MSTARESNGLCREILFHRLSANTFKIDTRSFEISLKNVSSEEGKVSAYAS